MKEMTECGLINILQLKKELLVKILDSTRKAAGLLTNDKLEEFDREMQSCGEFMKRVDEINEAAENLMKKAWKEPEQLQLENEMEYILNRITEANRECSDIAQEKLKGFGQQIKALRQTKQSIGSYTKKPAQEAIFFDAKK